MHRQERDARAGTAVQPPVYLDYQATTPVDARVLDAMLPWFREHFGNPHSTGYQQGRDAAAAIETARAQVAALVGGRAAGVIFTSGGTEANNLALHGALAAGPADKRHMITAATEHSSILEICRGLEDEGYDVTYLSVRENGLIDPAALSDAIREDTALISIMAVNNEIGVIQPLEEIGAICAQHGVLFHTDAAQAAGKIPLDVEAARIDLLSIVGHKIYGPKGIGALYRRTQPPLPLEPLIRGGGQEQGLRGGTLPTPLCVGLGAACAIAGDEMAAEAQRLLSLRQQLLDGIRGRLAGVHVNGDLEHRIPGNLNLSFEGVAGADLLFALGDLALSTGSACASGNQEPSHVLRALGLSDTMADASLRIGLGRNTTAAEVAFAADRIVAEVTRLRAA